MGILTRMKEKLMGSSESNIDEESHDYVELDTESSTESNAQYIVRPFIIEDFENVKPIIDTLREGNTVALINIKPLRDKDIIELKRAISKLKKTCDAIEGDIAGFGEDWIAAVPSFARIYRGPKKTVETGDIAQQTPIKDFSSGGEEI